MSEKASPKRPLDITDQEMAQSTFAAILAAQKGDDALAGEILRSMAEGMLSKFGTTRRKKKGG